MGTPLEIVKELYAKLTAGDAGGALALMSDDIEWITMMDYKVDGRGPQKVLEGILVPAMKEWEPYYTDAARIHLRWRQGSVGGAVQRDKSSDRKACGGRLLSHLGGEG